MKKKSINKRSSILIVLCFVFITNLNAQRVVKANWQKQLDNIFTEKWNIPPDSLAIYSFNFRLAISRNNNGKAVPSKITANDSLAYSLFPRYKKLYEIDFSTLLGSKRNIVVIVPVLMYGSSPEKKIYKDANGSALINFDAAVNAAYALYSSNIYSNKNDSKEDLRHRIFKQSKTMANNKSYEEIILYKPYVIEIFNIE